MPLRCNTPFSLFYHNRRVHWYARYGIFAPAQPLVWAAIRQPFPKCWFLGVERNLTIYQRSWVLLKHLTSAWLVRIPFSHVAYFALVGTSVRSPASDDSGTRALANSGALSSANPTWNPGLSIFRPRQQKPRLSVRMLALRGNLNGSIGENVRREPDLQLTKNSKRRGRA